MTYCEPCVSDLREMPALRLVTAITLLLVTVACSDYRPLLAASHWATHTPDPTSVRKTAQGEVIGYSESDGTQAWLGLPYAQAARWRAPVRAASWGGQRAALTFGDICTQLDAASTSGERVVGSEDCLSLNVYAPHMSPDSVEASRLPVMVWIHGGDNTIGSGALYGAFERVAQRYRLVIVTINYRLGILGWFRYPALQDEGSSVEDRSGNYGTLDQIAALRWVHDNIKAFGGDPSQVTVFGESSGAESVLLLMVSPLASGLFQRAIAESGLSNVTKSISQAENFVDDAIPGDPGSSGDVLERLLILDHRASNAFDAKRTIAAMGAAGIRVYLRSKTAGDLLKVFKPDGYGLYSSPHTFGDGAVLPSEQILAVFAKSQRGPAVPLIAGTNHDEFRLFALGDRELVGTWFGKYPHVRCWQRYRRLTGYQSEVWSVSGSDAPLTLLRERQGATVWSYRFDWDEEPQWPVNLRRLLGAAHGVELPFVLAAPQTPFVFHEVSRSNLPGRIKLSDAMVSYWAEFAYTGSPGRGRDGRLPEWKPWDNASEAEKRLVLGTDAQGGIRMTREALTFASVKTELSRDPALQQDVRERCYTYARAFRYFPSVVTSTAFDPAEYANLGCDAFPIEQFRPSD